MADLLAPISSQLLTAHSPASPFSWNACPGLCVVLWENDNQGFCLSRMYKVYFFLFWCFSGLFPLRLRDDEMARNTSFFFPFQECIQYPILPPMFSAVLQHSLRQANQAQLSHDWALHGGSHCNPTTWETRAERCWATQ